MPSPSPSSRLRAAFIGCGGHSFRWIYPSLQFAPVDLIATCDQDADRAARYAKQFGAERSYADHREMLDREDIQAVFLVVGYDQDNRPAYPPLAIDCLRAGRHVWMEKPCAGSCAEVEAMIAARDEAGVFAQVGFKKCFYPAIEKAKEIIQREDFGAPSTLIVRYPQRLPAESEKASLKEPGLHSFLDHIVHPASILQFLMGPPETLTYRRSANGGGFALLQYASGATGCLHFAQGQSGTSPLERLEVIGEGANVVVENGVKLTYYRPGARGAGGYTSALSFIGPDDSAPITWEPQFSLASMEAKTLCLEGFLPETSYFADCVLSGTTPAKATLEDALHVTRVYEAFLRPEGEVVRLG